MSNYQKRKMASKINFILVDKDYNFFKKLQVFDFEVFEVAQNIFKISTNLQNYKNLFNKLIAKLFEGKAPKQKLYRILIDINNQNKGVLTFDSK